MVRRVVISPVSEARRVEPPPSTQLPDYWRTEQARNDPQGNQHKASVEEHRDPFLVLIEPVRFDGSSLFPATSRLLFPK